MPRSTPVCDGVAKRPRLLRSGRAASCCGCYLVRKRTISAVTPRVLHGGRAAADGARIAERPPPRGTCTGVQTDPYDEASTAQLRISPLASSSASASATIKTAPGYSFATSFTPMSTRWSNEGSSGLSNRTRNEFLESIYCLKAGL